MKKKLLFVAAATALSASSFAGGFQLNLQGLRQTAMGGSGVAMPWDASSMFYNPGAFARLHSLGVSGNAFLTMPHVKFLQQPTGGYSYNNDTKLGTPIAAYIGGNLGKSDNALSKLAVGVGVYTPFGNSLHWDPDWTGRYMVQSISLSSIFFQPTVSYEIADVISIGAGFVYGIGNVEIDKAVPIQDKNGKDGHANLAGKASGIGFNAGVHIKASNNVSVGLSYRSGVRMKVKEGTAKFDVTSSVASNFPTTNFSSELPLPGILTGGVAVKATPKLTLQGDLVYAFWSSYDSLKFDFVDNTPAVVDAAEPREYRNTIAVRIGGNYEVNDWLDVMVGGAFDPTPSQTHLVSPDAVDANRISVSAGLSFKPVSGLTITAGASYTTTPVRETFYDPAGFQGSYKINSLTPALGISFEF